jgi:tRNA(fMet)-specific endonuclease VapC
VTLYLLDTNACVEYLRNRNPLVVQRIKARQPAELRLCSVVKAELYYGACHGPSQAGNLALLAAFFPPFISLPFDDPAAAIYGQIRAHLAALGQMIGPNDLMIAAIALVNSATLVSHNVVEFSRVPGLVVEDWQLP